MPANSGTFEEVFNFTRARTATYRDATGALQTAAVDTPRLDHDEDGQPLGLLIEGRPSTLHSDVLAPSDLDDVPGPATVLHDYLTASGERRMLAIYTLTPRITMRERIAICGHHRRIAHFSGFLPRSKARAGQPVRYNGESWNMPSFYLFDETSALDLGDGEVSLLLGA